MRRRAHVNRVTTGDLTQHLGGRSVDRNFRIVRMCSKVLFVGLISG
jgi:hypothetical protein